MMMIPPSTGRRRRRDGRHRGEGAAGVDGRRIAMNRRAAVWVAGLVLVGRAGQFALGQDLVNGGSVALTCGVCECEGSSDDGTVTVFDIPSSGERIASVNAAYSEILSTSCGTPAIATGSTIYELSGVDDLESREMDFLSMESTTCAAVEFTASSTADCFTGPTSTLEFDAGVTVVVTVHFATWFDEAEGATKYWYKLFSQVTGSNSVDQDHNLCFRNGFVSVVFDLTVLGKTTQYNYELDFNSPTSADLPVDSTPASTDALVCGAAITPAPLTPATPTPETPSPTAPLVPANTAAPVGVVATTPGPTPTVAVSSPPLALTDAPSPAVGGNATTTPAPERAATEAPAAAVSGGNVTATPAPSVAGLAETPVPTSADSQAQVTSSTTDNAELDENACILPVSSPCTLTTPVSNTNDGIGDYYDPACDVPEGEERPTGCDASSLCRRCYFNTPLYLENNNGSNPDYPDCPCCVLETYPADEAANLDGPRCENVTPAPTTVTQQPAAGGDVQRSFESLGFDDAGWKVNSGEAAALAALGLLAALTFFPICTK